jgi:hypothetical protein
MPIITFTSDFGEEDHYVAAVKAALLKDNPELKIVDISHRIHPYDIAHAGYVLEQVFHDFPPDTIHLVAVDTADRPHQRAIISRIEGHFFVHFDNGIGSLIGAVEKTIGAQLPFSTFQARDVLVPLCLALAKGKPAESLGQEVSDTALLMKRQPKVTKREIVGHVIRIDVYGNLITNIKKAAYEKIQSLNGQVEFHLQVGKERFRKFQNTFEEVPPGECFVIFNSNDHLEIGINKGNAAELLNIKPDTPIFIYFNV